MPDFHKLHRNMPANRQIKTGWLNGWIHFEFPFTGATLATTSLSFQPPPRALTS
jgi:hypothetical protein